MFSYFQAALLGMVEGITEFLPISSTGHLIIAAKLLGIPDSDFLKSFEIIIQFGAILAVMIIYGKKVAQNKELARKALLAFVPTGLIGFFLYTLIKKFLLGNEYVVVFSLIIGGAALILIENYLSNKNNSKNINNLSNKDAVLIGTCQSIAVIPGISRSAATIITGLFLGYDRKSIVEFSFLLAIPTILTASMYDLYKNVSLFSGSDVDVLAIGFISSFMFAYISVKWLLKYIATHNFKQFGYYRILAGILAAVILF